MHRVIMMFAMAAAAMLLWPSVAAAEQIKVTLDPARVTSGEDATVEITAQCPVVAGTELKGEASSDAFGKVDLAPIKAGQPGVRGEAKIKKEIKAGEYVVRVKCDTNESGQATLDVVGAAPTQAPTKAPKAGGGGTAPGGPSGGFPIWGVIVALAAGGALVAYWRRRAAQ